MLNASVLLLSTGPANLTGAFTGFPALANPDNLALRVQGHSVTVKLYLRDAESESLTLIKNESSTGGKITLRLPVRIRRSEGPGAIPAIQVAGSWDKSPITFRQSARQTRPADGDFVDQDGYATAQVPVKPNATHALRLNWKGDLLRAGRDLKMNALAYETSGARDWPRGVDVFNYSIRYQATDRPASPVYPNPKAIVSPVFAVQVLTPEEGWQVGQKGAFRRETGFAPGEETIWSFAYYPYTFREIGK